jgi:hypothetical protein
VDAVSPTIKEVAVSTGQRRFLSWIIGICFGSDIAWECRTLANAATHAEVREQLLEVAKQFERLARRQRLSQTKIFPRVKSES